MSDNTLTALIKKASPLTEASFYILVSLVEPLHGYGVMQKVGELSGNRVLLGPGTLYGALTNLLSLGLIEMMDEPEAGRKKLYCMTGLGRDLAEYETKRLEEVAFYGRKLLGLGEKNEKL